MKQKQHGSGLVFAVVLMFVILAMVVTLSSVTVLETKMSQKTKSSVGAFYNSESGVEWALNQIAQKAGDDPISTIAGWNGTYVPCPDSIGGESTCKVYFIDKNTNNVITGGDAIVSDIAAVRSVGTQTAGDTTQRAIEAAVAVSWSGTYVAWGDTNCPQGTRLYSGEAIYPRDAYGTGGIICFDGSIETKFPGGTGGSSQWANGDYQTPGPPGLKIDCVVCAQ